jgi:hypothetical protein
MSDKAHMNGDGESDSCVVPAKSANKLTPFDQGGADGGKAAGQGECGRVHQAPDSVLATACQWH